jgi:predicted HNH restriction endonuclease
MACGYDFEATYGIIGQGFAEVHHVVPLADAGTRETDPRTDLSVLCANCHRMVHRRRGVCLSLDELRAHIAAAKTSEN